MIVLLDNKDSFTYNLAASLTLAGATVKVLRVDKTTLEDVEALAPRALVISPGPGTPESATLSREAIASFATRVPVLGVCLGMQCIAVVFGASVGQAGELVHGEASDVHHHGESLFRGLESPASCVRYHSLSVAPDSLAGTPLQQLGVTDSGIPMAVAHQHLDVTGVQFHPESIGTDTGNQMVRTWVQDRGLHKPAGEVS